jgi:predicted nuclease of predicted toxin-antitoxin system
MKILIDEQLPVKLKYRFSETGYNVSTVRDMNWLGLKNGDLLKTMVANNFNVLITNDKNLHYQQKMDALKICVLNINARTNRYEDVFELLSEINTKLSEIKDHLAVMPGGYFIIS